MIQLTTKLMNMFSYSITTYLIFNNKNYNSCRNPHSKYQTCVGVFSMFCVLGWATSCGDGLGCLLRWWARIFLSKRVGAGPIVTQLGPICAQTYALSARSKLTASRTVADKLRQADTITIIKIKYSDYLNK